MAAASTILYAITLMLLLALHLTNREYNLVRNAVSDYGVGTSAGLFRIYVVVGSLGALSLAWLFYASPEPRFPSAIALYLVLMVVSRIGVAALPTDLEGAKRTPTGIAHYVFAIANFTLVYLVIDKATDFLVQDSHLASLHPIWPTLKWIVAAALAGIVLTMFRPLRSIFGFVERVFIFTYTIWFLLVAIWFLSR